MVDISPVQALDHKMPGEAEILAHLDRLLVQNLTRKVLCNATVVNIAQLILVVLMVEQVVHVDIVHVA